MFEYVFVTTITPTASSSSSLFKRKIVAVESKLETMPMMRAPSIPTVAQFAVIPT